MRRIVTGAYLVFLLGGAACAADDKAGDLQCIQQLIQAEALFYAKIEAKALSEAKAEEISKLLDEADALCTEGKYEKAGATLATANEMSSKAQE